MKRDIQRKKRKREQINEQESFVSRAVFHIVNVVKLVGKYEFIDLSDEKNIFLAINKAINLIAKVVEKESKSRGSVYTHDKFFKEIKTNDIIRDYVNKTYENHSLKKV